MLVALLLLASGCAQHVPEPDEGPAMTSLTVELRIARTELLFQESPVLDFTLHNQGSAPIEVAHPGHTESVPRVRLVRVDDGTELLFSRDASFLPPPTQPLEPGGSIEWSLTLHERGRLPGPGSYDVSLIHPFGDGSETAESEPVRITALPSTGRNLALASTRGAPGPELNAAWIDVTSEPPQLVRGSFQLEGGMPRVDLVAVLASVPPGSEPRVSAPTNGTVSYDHWVAWLEERSLKALHVGEQSGASPVRTLGLSDALGMIVPPLHIEPLVAPESPAPGEALVWQPGPRGGRLLAVDLLGTALLPGASADLSGPKPEWIETFTRTTGKRRVLVAQVQDKRVTLRATSWPGPDRHEQRLDEWDGTLLAAGASIDTHDTIHGALLLATTSAAETPALRLVQWQLTPDDQWELMRQDELDLGGAPLPVSARIAVSNGAVVYTALGGPSGRVTLFRSADRLTNAGADIETNGLPYLAFPNDHDALLIRSIPGRGWQPARLDGTPFEASDLEQAIDDGAGDPLGGFEQR